jgi:hypothetical protein
MDWSKMSKEKFLKLHGDVGYATPFRRRRG